VGGFELVEVFPEEVTAVDDLAAAHVEEVDSEHVVFEVEAEDVGVFIGVGRGDALAVLRLRDGDELVAKTRGELELHVLRGLLHACGEAGFELAGFAFEEELHVADGLLVIFLRDQAFDAGAEAALDVVLQAGARMIAVEVDLAGRDEEAAMDDVDKAMREVAGEVWAEVGGAVFAQAAGDEDLGVTVGQS